jgi:hypothetical protein
MERNFALEYRQREQRRQQAEEIAREIQEKRLEAALKEISNG